MEATRGGMTCIYFLLSLQLLVLQGLVAGDSTHAVDINTTTTSLTTQATDGDTLTSSSTATGTPDVSTSGNSKGQHQLQQDLELLLDELRQVAAAIHDVRTEHGQLAKNVAEMSLAVKDMSERNMHIRKKVRKMSKVLNKSTHHHKYKDGLRALQKDHKKILEAMSFRNISLAGLGLNRSIFHHHHHQRGNLSDILDQDSESDQEELSAQDIEDAVAKKLQQEIILNKKDIKLPIQEENEDANLIPDLVVEPPEGKTSGGVSYPRDCREVMDYGNYTSGVYTIQPEGLQKPIRVWCDQKTEGGGWTVLLARVPTGKDQLNFSRSWNDYKYGFGDPASEYWIGNEALHVMTSVKRNQLRVNITDWSDTEAYADWRDFTVASELKQYKLSVTRYAPSSTAGDAMKWHNEMKFSTVDRDNDALMGGHCARTNDAGWWYRGHRGCYQAHPTGRYQNNPGKAPLKTKGRNFDIGPVLVWQNWRGESYYPKTLFLMFRPVLY